MDAGNGEIGSLTTFLAILLAVNVGALIVMTVLYRKAKKASRQRRVEAPNSEYKSQYVVDLEAQERWERVDLSLLHEVNREEFQKHLERVRATSPRAITPAERAFLDRMADAHDRVKGSSSRRPRHLPGTS